MQYILAISTLIGLSLAQTKTVTLPMVGFDRDSPLVASVISANPTATTLALACPPVTASGDSECGLFPAQILTVGPSIWLMDMSDPTPDSDFTMTQDCSIDTKASSAVCKESAGGSEANFPGSSTATYEPGQSFMEVVTLPITITKGAEKLTAGGSAPTASATGSGNAAASTGASASGTMATSTSAGASAPGASASAPPQSSGAAAANAVMLGGGFIGAAAAMLGGLVL